VILADLQARIHANAVAKGWWPTDRSWPEIRILIVSEIAEALEEYRAGRMAVWFNNASISAAGTAPPGSKPEGFPVEIADAAIRLLDYAGRRGWTLEMRRMTGADTVPEQLDEAVDALYAYAEDGEHWACDEALSYLFAIAEVHGFDLLATIELKHAFNETRPHRHGGKAA
jgi:hypothetical protein